MRNRRTSVGAASVVVVGVDHRGMGLIRECLGTEAVLPTNATAVADALQVVRKTRPNVVVMGFDADFDAAVRLGHDLKRELAGLHMVAISERADPERIRSAMRAGFREYVVLPEDADLLRKAVHEAAYGGSDDEEAGEVVAVVGTKGGCGVSLLTVNLAAELTPLHRVCVVDLDFSMGDVAALLDLEPKSSIHDLLRNLDRLDERMLAGSVVVHPSKVHVLPQPTELMEFEEVHGEDVLGILRTAAAAYQYVFIDCGGRIDEATLMATTVADRVLLVTTPSVAGVKNAWRRLQLMSRLGIDKEHVRLVVNEWERGAELTLGDIEKNLGVSVAATIAADPATCNKAVNLGRLLRDVDRRSPALRDISAAVQLVTTESAKVEAEQPKGSFWGLFRS